MLSAFGGIPQPTELCGLFVQLSTQQQCLQLMQNVLPKSTFLKPILFAPKLLADVPFTRTRGAVRVQVFVDYSDSSSLNPAPEKDASCSPCYSNMSYQVPRAWGLEFRVKGLGSEVYRSTPNRVHGPRLYNPRTHVESLHLGGDSSEV